MDVWQSKNIAMNKIIYWFRTDLRLIDNAALTYACDNADQLIPVYIHAEETDLLTIWGTARMGPHRPRFLADTLADLSRQLAARGSRLIQLSGRPQDVMPLFAQSIGANNVVCETIAAPQKEDEILALQNASLVVKTFWQSSMLDPADLPFPLERLPDVFTHSSKRSSAISWCHLSRCRCQRFFHPSLIFPRL